MGYLQPHGGRRSLFGKPLNEWLIIKLVKIRVVTRQNSYIAFSFSMQEVICMGRHPYRTRNAGDETGHIMTSCSCQALVARDYRYLLGGEQQWVQLARPLVQPWELEPRPEWLFLDKPIPALGIHHQQHLFRLLRRLVGERQLSVRRVLHDLNLAAYYANRVILTGRDRVIDNGHPWDVLQQLSLNALCGTDLTVMNELQHRAPPIVLN